MYVYGTQMRFQEIIQNYSVLRIARFYYRTSIAIKTEKLCLMLTIIWTDWVDGSNLFNLIAIGILPIWINELTNFVGIGNAGDRNGLNSFYII